MSAFLSDLVFLDKGGFPLILTTPLTYRSDVLVERSLFGGGVEVKPLGVFAVPTGFKTDLASVPRLLWNILPPLGTYDAAAVLHDYLYQFNGVTRAQADAVLNEAMGVLGVGRWTRWTIYTGVRLGGGRIWARYRAAAAQLL